MGTASWSTRAGRRAALLALGCLVAALLVPLLLAASARAATCNGNTLSWTGKGDNVSWRDQGNWDPRTDAPPKSGDVVNIAATANENFYVNAPTSVCELNLSGDQAANAKVYFHAGAGITVTDFNVSGSGVYWDGSITASGTTTIDGAAEYGGGVGTFPMSPTYLTTQNLTVAASSNLELADGTSDVAVTGNADIGPSTIWSNSSSATDNIGQLQLKGTASLSGDVTAEVDWQLGPAAQLDLGGHTLDVRSHSFSRWSNGSSVTNSGLGSGHVAFHDGTWLIADGTVNLGPGVNVALLDTSRLADGADYTGQAQPAGTSGEFAGTGNIEWVSGYLRGAIQLDSGITTTLDGGGTRYVGEASATTPISQLINVGHLIVADGTLSVPGDIGTLNNTGVLEIKTGAHVTGNAFKQDVVNEPSGEVVVTMPLTPVLAPAVMQANLQNHGVIHVPANLTLQLTNGQQNLLGDGGAVSGGGTVQVTDHTSAAGAVRVDAVGVRRY